MKLTFLIIGLLILSACGSDDYSFISLRNGTGVPIYALPYSSEYANGDWIQPGSTDEFQSLNIEGLDGYDYFSYYYDSLIVYLEGMDDMPVKFYKNGRTVNYDKSYNPFVNRDAWSSHHFEKKEGGNHLESVENQQVMEFYFTIDPDRLTILGDTLWSLLNPAPQS